jgi:hypothetical protein
MSERREVMSMTDGPMKQVGPGHRSAEASFAARCEEVAKKNEAAQRRALKERADREADERAARRRRDLL